MSKAGKHCAEQICCLSCLRLECRFRLSVMAKQMVPFPPEPWSHEFFDMTHIFCPMAGGVKIVGSILVAQLLRCETCLRNGHESLCR